VTDTPRDRLARLGLELPAPPAALAAYVPARTVPLGDGRVLVFVSGQIALIDGRPMHQGRVPDEVSIDEARANARQVALNILAQFEQAVGLENIEQVTQLSGWVQSGDGFGGQPQVINAASDLLRDVLGEAGRHTRAAVGSNALPLNVPVEIAAIAVGRVRPPGEAR
jgi:enamine deaminase RidA (YjgF/YER057c/UK114 family)